MYKLYIDKPELFEASIQIEGANIDNSICRLSIQNKNHYILFEGNISNNIVKIPITSLKSIISEGDFGKIKLEIIADDTFFVPWESEYQACYSKKVTAEVKQNDNLPNTITPSIKVTSVGNSPVLNNQFINELTTAFRKKNISLMTVKTDINTIKLISKKINSKYNIHSDQILDHVIKALNNIKI